MRHKISGRKLRRSTPQRQALFRGLITDLLRYERVRTTEAKAKEVRGMAEKVITLGKDGTLHARRQALRVVTDTDIVKKVFDDIAPRYATRPGGYTRIVKLGRRAGDGQKSPVGALSEGAGLPEPSPARHVAAAGGQPQTHRPPAGIRRQPLRRRRFKTMPDDPG
jgi:large subunit ribosomal protein L17